MSPLLREWYGLARCVAEAAPSDKFFAAEDSDPRVAFERRVALGGVVDGRPSKPGVLFVGIASDGGDEDTQILAVTSRALASVVVQALLNAWPDLIDREPRPGGEA